MATGETGFDDVSFDLISVQYHSLKAGHDYGQYVRDAKNAGLDDIAAFFEQVMAEDSERARRCHEFLAQITGSSQAGPAMSRSPQPDPDPGGLSPPGSTSRGARRPTSRDRRVLVT